MNTEKTIENFLEMADRTHGRSFIGIRIDFWGERFDCHEFDNRGANLYGAFKKLMARFPTVNALYIKHCFFDAGGSLAVYRSF